MKGTLCVYYSRSGFTKTIANQIKNELNCELLEISDKEDRIGVKGYFKCIVDTLFNRPIKLNSFGTGKKIQDYRNIIICSPIWISRVCPIVKAFLVAYGSKFTGNVYFISTQKSRFKICPKKLLKMNSYLNSNIYKYISISEKNDNSKIIKEFLKEIK